MIKIFFIGSGKIAYALGNVFRQTNAEITGIYSTNTHTGEQLSKQLNCNLYTDIAQIATLADVFFLTVPDSQIALVQSQLNTQALVVHCSGLTNINALNNQQNSGVFWPVQSFSLGISYQFNQIPICLEANNDENYRILEQLADKISKKVFQVNSEQRQYLHLAAVFANNFTNHLYAVANKIVSKNQLDFNILKPLITETANKILMLEPKDAQTGPALRGDLNTIERHLELLKSEPELRQLYELFSVNIKKQNS